MKEKLHHFFGCFFSHNEAKKSENKSSFASILSIICALILIALMLSLGRSISFHALYSGADEFKDFAMLALGSDGAKIKISDGKLQNDILINSFENSEDEIYRKNGYDIIVDSRNISELYDDFTLMCIPSFDGLGKVSYERYLTLPKEQQAAYSKFTIEYSGKVLDPKAEYEAYKAYLDVVSTEGTDHYDEEAAKVYKQLDSTSESYYNDIYELYVIAFYPDAENAEKSSPAPTIEGYYTDIMSRDKDGKYIVLLSDTCYISYTSGIISDIFLGSYANTPSIDLSSASAEQTDNFIKGVFRSTESLNYYIFFLKTFDFAPLVCLILSIGILSFVLFKLHKKAYPNYRRTYGECIKISASFGLICGVIASLLGLIMSFILSQAVIFAVTYTIFIIIVIVRNVLFIIKDLHDDSYNAFKRKNTVSLHRCD